MPNIQFSLSDALKYIEWQENIEEFCKMMRYVRDNIMMFSPEEKQTLGSALLGKLLAQGVVLPGKSKAKNYVEVVHKVVDGEWLVLEVSQPPVAGSFDQHAAEA